MQGPRHFSILHRGGYGLHGIYSLEEYYAKHLADYHNALNVSTSHNFDMGREAAEITNFIAYFCHGMADSPKPLSAAVNPTSPRFCAS